VRTALDHGAARVVAVEPAPWKEPCLRRTFAKEIQDGKVIVYPKGVWNTESKLKLDDDTLSDTGVEVQLTTIDNLVRELKLDRVDVIKMDIEGAEKPALHGGKSTIQRFRPRLTIATEHKADDFTELPKLLRGFDPTYTAECGPCVGQFGRLQPYTMFFVAR
jgi:FkbM family methyltransferase